MVQSSSDSTNKTNANGPASTNCSFEEWLERRATIIDNFSIASSEAIDTTLAGLNARKPQHRLHDLLTLQKQLNQIIGERITSTRRELRDTKISQSPLLSQSPEIWRRISLYLDETSLYNLEKVTDPVYATCGHNQRPNWGPQWLLLDRIRHSKSCIRGEPRIRGLQFAKASLAAQQWERLQLESPIREEDGLVLQVNETKSKEVYRRKDFKDDFGYFFQDPTQAGDPNVEFFLRLSYSNKANPDKKEVLLEGFQSKYISLRHTNHAEDTGYHTHIGAGGDRLQVVMVRNDLHLLRARMGLDDYYSAMDSDDSELESDEEEEFHFLQWPEDSRREFLDNLTITILRYDCGPRRRGGRHMNPKDSAFIPRIVGSTRGYYESDQHFAMFWPLRLTTREENGEEIPGEVRIGLGCGGGDSLHLVIKWL